MPDILKYDGTSDPRDHVTAITTSVKGNDLTKQEIESVLVKIFGKILTKGALTCENGKQVYMKNRQEPPKPPSPKRTVNVISGGEGVNNVTYTAAKKMSKVTVTYEKRIRQVLEEDNIMFDDVDADGVMVPHNDTLKQVDDKLVPKARTLYGFDNSSIVTKGEIMLTTFVKGVVKDTKFQVIDTDMAYNMILDRPWIHEMDVVPSTLHRVIEFPSQWGIRQIRSDQQASRSINLVGDSSIKNDTADKK
ncbi:uncharacterized protein LOC142181302 [Nicotiana tabacum]|uniref:Uncharacterized protein LOC142181302 n=1 Tax=Nicotiana tabacum TaxID=4097 RepID=A0AC58ULP9_TOBAC